MTFDKFFFALTLIDKKVCVQKPYRKKKFSICRGFLSEIFLSPLINMGGQKKSIAELAAKICRNV